MGKTNFDELELSGALTATDIAASGTLTYDDLAVTDDVTVGGDLDVTGGATVGGALEITQGLSAGGQISSSGDILAFGDIVANGELRAYDNVTFGEVASPVGVGIKGDLTLTGNPKLESVLDEVFAATEPNATDEGTAVALVNDIKAQYNKLITYLRTGQTDSTDS